MIKGIRELRFGTLGVKRILRTTVVPRRAGRVATREFSIIRSIVRLLETGCQSIHFLLQLDRIILVLLFSFCKLLLLLRPFSVGRFFHRDAPMNNRRPFTAHCHTTQGGESNLAVRFQLPDGHMQQLGTILEAIIGMRFGRQIFREIPLYSQQILKCIVVFVSRQAAKRRMPAGRAPYLRSPLNFVRKPFDNLGAIGVFERFCIRRRHLTVAEHGLNFQPPVRVRPIHKVRIQCVDPDVAFDMIRPVTLHASFFQHRFNELFELSGSVFRLSFFDRRSSLILLPISRL